MAPPRQSLHALGSHVGTAGTELELLLASLRLRFPRAAVLLLTPVDQTCVRGLKRMKPFQKVPVGVEGTMAVLRRCYGNDTAASAIESIGAAHGLAVVSQRHALRRRFFSAPADATRLISSLVVP